METKEHSLIGVVARHLDQTRDLRLTHGSPLATMPANVILSPRYGLFELKHDIMGNGLTTRLKLAGDQ